MCVCVILCFLCTVVPLPPGTYPLAVNNNNNNNNSQRPVVPFRLRQSGDELFKDEYTCIEFKSFAKFLLG